MGTRFYATWMPKPGASVPLVFPSAAARDAFVRSRPGKAAVTRAAAAPKRVVSNVSQIGA